MKNKIYWCDNCKIPVINSDDKKSCVCSLCNTRCEYLCTDIRPVFPEERLLLELLLDKPFCFENNSVWAGKTGRFYADGKIFKIPQALYTYENSKIIREKLKMYKNSEFHFKKHKEFLNRFVKANFKRLRFNIFNSTQFIRESRKDFTDEQIAISFSGGKDSTVIADLVTKALGNMSLIHVFGDTTLEQDELLDYTYNYQKNHPYAIFKTAKNKDQNFFEVCKDIGPPARKMLYAAVCLRPDQSPRYTTVCTEINWFLHM